MIGIYHNRDLDGFASGAIIKIKYPNAKMLGYDYGMPIPELPKGQEIIMADISFPMEEMNRIAKVSKSLMWIDHHKSSINDFESFFAKAIPESLHPCCRVGIAACELTWMALFTDKEMPLAVSLLGEYDTWRNQDKDKWENKILPFQFGMRQRCNSLETFPVEVFENERLVKDIISEGKIILKYQAQVSQYQCKRAAFEAEFNGLRAICLNGGGFNSDVFKSIYDESRHDIMMPFQFNGTFWTISLYTTKDDIDCSAIAKANGGGGHRKAAGFQVNDIGTVFSQL